MKTTLDIDDQLLIQAKVAAALERSTLTRLVEEGLALRLRKCSDGPRKSGLELPVYHGKGGLLPGIDPTSNRSMFEAADE